MNFLCFSLGRKSHKIKPFGFSAIEKMKLKLLIFRHKWFRIKSLLTVSPLNTHFRAKEF